MSGSANGVLTTLLNAEAEPRAGTGMWSVSPFLPLKESLVTRLPRTSLDL